MFRLLVLTCALHFGGGMLCAQREPVPPPREPVPVAAECLVASDAGVWTALQLTPDQIERLRDIEVAMRMEGSILTGDGNNAVLEQAMHARYLQEVEDVLSPEQFGRWRTWCAEHQGHALRDH